MKNEEIKLMYKELDYGVDTKNNIIYLSDSLLLDLKCVKG